jgi:hypothetical protein
MQSGTIETLDQLEKAFWFSRVGINEESKAAVVTSWLEAIVQCSSFEWEDLRLDALNQCRLYIAEHSKERLRHWNDTVDEVKKITGPLVERKIAPSFVNTLCRKYSKFGFVMISPISAWNPNTRTCVHSASLRTLGIGTSTDTFLVVGRAYFPRASL